MMFKPGDPVVHPARGAGIVICIETRQWHGSTDLYYRIKLLGQQGISLMIPIHLAETLGLRPAISLSRLNQVWRVLCADPETLPADHKQRYELLEGKLHAGSVFQVAEAVRDMAWRQRQRGHLTTVGKQMYEKGLALLTGEIAAAQGIDLANAETQVKTRLSESLSPGHHNVALMSPGSNAMVT